MQTLVFFSIFLSSLFTFAQKTNQQAWEKVSQLSWEDYKAEPSEASSFKALTSTGVVFEIQYEGNVVTITVANFFHPDASWTKNRANDHLLAHEQLHFDISELFARKLRQEIAETTFNSRGKTLMSDISEIYQKKMKELANFQKKYDEETNHSITEDIQKSWETEVKMEIRKLDQYASSEIKLFLNE